MELQKYKIEPHYALLMTSLLSFYPDNTKISINDYVILFRNPTIYQGIIRWGYGETRNDIFNLIDSIKIGLIFLKKNYDDVNTILFNLFNGINKLKLCYILDDTMKIKLENLEVLVQKLYETGMYTYETEPIRQFKNLWSQKELKHINSVYINLNNLFKLPSIPLQEKINLREKLLQYLQNFMNCKNNLFKNKYLKNLPQLMNKKLKTI